MCSNHFVLTHEGAHQNSHNLLMNPALIMVMMIKFDWLAPVLNGIESDWLSLPRNYVLVHNAIVLSSALLGTLHQFCS